MKNKAIKDIVLLQCSARNNGDTAILSAWVESKFEVTVLNLCDFNIHPFDYENRFENDDFLPLITKIAKQSKALVFTTPVYWYTMSSQMKIFLDRISDLLKWHKPIGRLLRGKHIGLLSVCNDSEVNTAFEIPVKLSAEYLGMYYTGHLHNWIIEKEIPAEVQNALDDYFKKLLQDLT